MLAVVKSQREENIATGKHFCDIIKKSGDQLKIAVQWNHKDTLGACAHNATFRKASLWHHRESSDVCDCCMSLSPTQTGQAVCPLCGSVADNRYWLRSIEWLITGARQTLLPFVGLQSWNLSWGKEVETTEEQEHQKLERWVSEGWKLHETETR